MPIAGNDDAIRSVELITKAIADAIVEARREAPVREEAEEGESYTYSSDRGAEPAGEEERRSAVAVRAAVAPSPKRSPRASRDRVRAVRPARRRERTRPSSAKSIGRRRRHSPRAAGHRVAFMTPPDALPAAFPRQRTATGLNNGCTITAKDVAALRERTGAGMMDCKKALEETERRHRQGGRAAPHEGRGEGREARRARRRAKA